MAIPSKAELLQLDLATRLDLIEELWESIASSPNAAAELPVTDEERAMLDERLRQHADAPDEARPWTDVRSGLITSK